MILMYAALDFALPLVEVSLDGGQSWQMACAPGYLTYHLSRFVEHDRDWRKRFAEFEAIVDKEITTSSALSSSTNPS
jgi:hypothetical protein